MRSILILSAHVILAFSLSAAPLFWEDRPPEILADRLLSAMSEEEILGQVFLVGYASDVPTPEIMAWIRSRNIGGVKIFGWNAENLAVLGESISRMQKAAVATSNGIPLFVATDQEGGWVRHVKGATSVTPGNLALGASGLPYDAYRTGYHIGEELHALGINMNFAPTVDVYINPQAHVIGPRAFASDPVLTGTLAIAYYRGMAKAGIICTAKHFPGHGNADEDSHGVMPTLMDSFEDLWKRDLLPYRLLISEKIPAILSGHLSFPEITGDRKPASLSPFFSREVLRNRLGFEGILMTDDLYMTGAQARGMPLSEVCVEALAAGNDMIMLSKTPGLNEEIWQAVQNRYRRDPKFKKHIHEAVRRIIMTKLQYLKDVNAVPLDPDPEAIRRIPTAESRAFFFEQACRSVTLVKNPGKTIPFNPPPGERVLLAGQHRNFFVQGKVRYPRADEFFFSYSPFYWAKPEDKAAFRRMAENYDTIIFCMSNPNSLEVLKTIKDFKGKVIVFSILTPVYLSDLPWVSSALAVYGWSVESFKAGFAALRGDFIPEGRLPINLHPAGRKP
jgi:beta-N-acetylhexosaminidase